MSIETRVRAALAKKKEPEQPTPTPRVNYEPGRASSVSYCHHEWVDASVLVELFGDPTVNQICKHCRSLIHSANPDINPDAKVLTHQPNASEDNPVPHVAATTTLDEILEELHRASSDG